MDLPLAFTLLTVCLRSQPMPSISLSAVLNPENSGGYVALCPELDIASQGESIDDAVQNLKEAVEGFFEVASREEIESRRKGPALFTHFKILGNWQAGFITTLSASRRFTQRLESDRTECIYIVHTA